MLLENRLCVISGVGPGLGKKVALALASQGADLVLAARRVEALEAVAREVSGLGRRAEVVPTDITDPNQCRTLAERAAAVGRVDVLVNNAYVEDVFMPFEQVDLAEWKRISEVNLFGSLQVTQCFVPQLKENGGGSVIFVNSMIVRKPRPLQGGYAISKGGLFTAAQVLAKELGRYRIRVNSVLPGWMWGPQVELYVNMRAQHKKISEEQVVAELLRDIPLGSVPTDDEVAGAVVFLASDLSSAITGQAIDVNGGEIFA